MVPHGLCFLVFLCRLLITFANSLAPDQAWQNIRPDLELTVFDTLKVFTNLEKVD